MQAAAQVQLCSNTSIDTLHMQPGSKGSLSSAVGKLLTEHLVFQARSKAVEMWRSILLRQIGCSLRRSSPKWAKTQARLCKVKSEVCGACNLICLLLSVLSRRIKACTLDRAACHSSAPSCISSKLGSPTIESA